MSGSHEQETRTIGRWMLYAFWLVVLVLLTLIFNGWLERQHNPNGAITTQIAGDMREVVLQRNRSGHYVANGRINGEPVVFLLDTGATDIAVPGTLAERLGLERGPTAWYSTANGTVQTFLTRLGRVSLGDIELRDLRGNINPHMEGEEVLLGMSFLRHLELVQRGDTLTLRQQR